MSALDWTGAGLITLLTALTITSIALIKRGEEDSAILLWVSALIPIIVFAGMIYDLSGVPQ